ncbi:VOC family protein [Nesterenkonia ebinurensis]|uniref:hypothetical protein n=1 Tax=Nesterenkonia ebinurensis TaxID=2608252 RepID=UPI00168A71AF|nr:hypothetical protein [Nesterenkonia ebinurensis]
MTYLFSEDLEAASERVVELGAAVERPRVELDGTQWFELFGDTADVQWGLRTNQPKQ